MRGYRVWAEINLNAFRHNVRTIRKIIGPNVKLMAVVKANAYGHGAVPIAYRAMAEGCSMLGVDDSTEAIQLREQGISAPILVLGAIVEEEIQRLVEYDIQVSVHSRDLLRLLDRAARKQAKRISVHLKVDSGLTRLGVTPRGASAVARAVADHPNLQLKGFFTHFAAAGLDPEFTRRQLSIFRNCLWDLARRGHDLESVVVHSANSAAVFHHPESHGDMVRCGNALYGLVPKALRPMRKLLRPVLSLKTRIVYLKRVPAGTTVGYERKYVCERETKVATCPVGYNDGYPYSAANRAAALVRGCRAPVIGSVSMDYLTLDVSDIEYVSVGDEVTLVGTDGDEEIWLDELADLDGSLPSRLTCGLGPRVRRIQMDPSEEEVPRSPAVMEVVRTGSGT